MGLDGNAEISRNLAYCALVVAISLSLLSIWRNRKEYFRHGNSFKLVIVVILCALLLIATKNIGMVLSLPVGLILINTKDRTIFKYIFYSSLVLYCLTVIFYTIGFINGGDVVDTPLFDNKENVQQLYSLGFNNPNVAYKFFMPILLSALYLFGERKRIILLLFIVSVVLGLLTGSTAGFIVAGIACLGFAAINREGMKKFVRKIIPYAFAFLTISSFLVALVFGSASSVPNPVNDALTGRPRLWNLRIDNNSYLNVLGNNDQYPTDRFDDKGIEQSYYALDNTFLYLMVHYGLVIYVLYFLVYSKSSLIIRDEKLLLIGLLLLLVLFIGERSDFFSNIYLLFAIKYLALNYFHKEKLNA